MADAPKPGEYDDLGPADDTDGAPDTAYNPTAVQVTRGRQQGLGMGAEDLGLQRDATEPAPAADEDEEDGEGI